MSQQRLNPTTTTTLPPLAESDLQVPVATHGKLPRNNFVYYYSSLNMYRALKRTKAYSNLEDVRPTVRNKPSGLQQGWLRTISKSSMPVSCSSTSATSSTPSRSSTPWSSSSSTLVSPSPSSLSVARSSSSLTLVSPSPSSLSRALPTVLQSPLLESFPGSPTLLVDRKVGHQGQIQPTMV